MDTNHARRRLLGYLAGSPLFRHAPVAALAGLPGGLAAQIVEDRDYLPEVANAAVNVFDMENAARARLSAAHWTYIAQGVDDELTLRANREGYHKLQLRARRLVDVSEIDTGRELFGEALPSPIILAPVGGLGMAHPQGDIEAARGARDSGHRFIQSTAATFGIEPVAEAYGAAPWFQLYPTSEWSITQALLRRAEAAGSRVCFLTVDIPARNQDRMRRFDQSAEDCRACHRPGTSFNDKAMMQGLDLPPGATVTHPGMTWDYVRRLRDATGMRLVIKGLTLAEDAEHALAAGVDGILVSNHGGRAEESGVGTIESLPEVAAVVRGRIPLLVDGGIRRGTDILKALALGADAVCVGRPYVWGLGAFGAAGVSRVGEILDAELRVAMMQAGTPRLADIDASVLRS